MIRSKQPFHGDDWRLPSESRSNNDESQQEWPNTNTLMSTCKPGAGPAHFSLCFEYFQRVCPMHGGSLARGWGVSVSIAHTIEKPVPLYQALFSAIWKRHLKQKASFAEAVRKHKLAFKQSVVDSFSIVGLIISKSWFVFLCCFISANL